MEVLQIWEKSMDIEPLAEKRHMEKKELRKKILSLRDSIPFTERRERSLWLEQQLLEHPAYQEAEYILSYVNFRSEVETTWILEKTLQSGTRKLYCPRVCGKEMEFYRICGMADLKAGAYGILEPEAREEHKFRPDSGGKILMVMPGAVFDRNHNRIGYGGGFYDRYLAKMEQMQADVVTAALLFSCQLVEKLPKEEHDQSVDVLISEESRNEK